MQRLSGFPGKEHRTHEDDLLKVVRNQDAEAQLFFKYCKHAMIFSQAADKNNAFLEKDTVDHSLSAANETGVQFPRDFPMLLLSGNQGCDLGFGKQCEHARNMGSFFATS
jgi:hypothetical protein